MRQCRDFEQFEAWARERTACYAFPTSEDFGEPLETHFGFCPEGSDYAAGVRRFFGEGGEVVRLGEEMRGWGLES